MRALLRLLPLYELLVLVRLVILNLRDPRAFVIGLLVGDCSLLRSSAGQGHVVIVGCEEGVGLVEVLGLCYLGLLAFGLGLQLLLVLLSLRTH